MNRAAVIAGSIRALSGVSFLVAPERAQLLWSQREASDPTARLLLRSMGYRDLLIGAGLIVAGVRDEQKVPGWFLASAGADAAIRRETRAASPRTGVRMGGLSGPHGPGGGALPSRRRAVTREAVPNSFGHAKCGH